MSPVEDKLRLGELREGEEGTGAGRTGGWTRWGGGGQPLRTKHETLSTKQKEETGKKRKVRKGSGRPRGGTVDAP